MKKNKIFLILDLLLICILQNAILFSDTIWNNYYNPWNADGIYVSPHMQICSDGSFAVTGHYVIEDPEGGWIDWRGFVMKISDQGNLLWVDKDTLSFMGWNGSDAIIETSDDGLINCGDGYMIKRDSEGNRIWSHDLNTAPTTMCYSHNGNIVLSGSGPNGSCLFRIIDNDGNEILNNDFSIGLYSTSSKRIIPTSDNGFAITGRITNQVPNSDIFICKTDAIGDTQWTYSKDGCGNSDVGNWIIENSENQLLCVGGILPEPLTIRGYISLINLDGNIIWEEIVGNNDIWYEHFYAIDIPDDESFMMSTLFRYYKCNYDYSTIEWINEEPPGYFQLLADGYIFYIGGIDGVHLVKTDYDLVESDDLIFTSDKIEFKCLPNPFNNEIRFSFKLDFFEDFVVNIYNSKGQNIKKYKASYNDNSIIWNGLDENGKRVSSGIYFVTLNSNRKTVAYNKITLIQ